jgi:hypothetical protein
MYFPTAILPLFKNMHDFFGGVRKIAKSHYQLRHVCLCLSVCLSVCPSAWNNSAPIGQIFMKCYVSIFFENLSRNSKFY